MHTNILSSQDTTSLITPVIGFPTREAAQQHIANIHDGRAVLIHPEYGRERWYVTIQGDWNATCGTGLLTRHPNNITRRALRPIWHPICQAGLRQGTDIYVSSLLSSGRRRFEGGVCYAAWAKRNGEGLDPVLVIDQQEDGVTSHKIVFSTKAAHGVVYTATPVFDEDSVFAGKEARLLLLLVQVMDRDPEKDDRLRIEIVSQVHQPMEPGNGNPRPNLRRVPPEDEWINLVEQAYEGFNHTCTHS